MLRRMKRSPVAALAVLALAVLAALALLRPLSARGLRARPHPARSYAEAVRIVDSLRAEDGPAVAAECGTGLLTHGERTSRVVVLLHGLTNCPAQFDSLGRIAYAAGANVLIPRLPRHGMADRMTGELARLGPREMCAFTDRVLDAADGLGDSVTVAGLSIGGVLAAWAGQERADVDRAVVIAPMLAWAQAPGPWRTAALARLGSVLPNAFVWWDDKLKSGLRGPKHVYPRFATRSVAATLDVGGAVMERAGRAAPAARTLVMITVGGDIAADNGTAASLVRAWRAHGAADVRTYEFPAALHLNHDVVDPEQVGGNPALTYPVLSGYIAR
jgi:carboxylesterase